MGVERAVTRWYILRQNLLSEVSGLELKLEEWSGAQASAPPSQPLEAPTRTELEAQLSSAYQRLRQLGPCPRPMMG